MPGKCQSGAFEAELPVSCECWGERLSAGVKPMMQLAANLPGVLCPLHAGLDLTYRDSIMAYNINCVAHNVNKSCCRCSCILKSCFYSRCWKHLSLDATEFFL